MSNRATERCKDRVLVWIPRPQLGPQGMGKEALAMKTIACVLKTGNWKNRHMRISYEPKHVQWLKRMVARHYPRPHRFVCLSDAQIKGVEVIPLRDGLPGWWSKLELFRELGDCFYLDLDTVVVGDISELVDHPHRFTALRNLSDNRPNTSRMGSAVMAWSGDYSGIYRRFMQDRELIVATYTTSDMWGDQGFIRRVLNGEFDRWQDLFPGRIVSQKMDMKDNALPDGAKIVCFHGKPKPWEIKADWIPEL